MRKFVAILGSALFFLLAPGFVAGLAPWWIAGRAPGLRFPRTPLQSLALLLIAAGTLVLLDAFARFALQGLGTPAPVLPTRHLVVTGLYRRVRNPMYVAVLTVILGQSLLLGSARVLVYASILWLVFHLFVLVYEEPALRRAYGGEYEQFCAKVPRWIPRLTAWRAR